MTSGGGGGEHVAHGTKLNFRQSKSRFWVNQNQKSLFSDPSQNKNKNKSNKKKQTKKSFLKNPQRSKFMTKTAEAPGLPDSLLHPMCHALQATAALGQHVPTCLAAQIQAFRWHRTNNGRFPTQFMPVMTLLSERSTSTLIWQWDSLQHDGWGSYLSLLWYYRNVWEHLSSPQQLALESYFTCAWSVDHFNLFQHTPPLSITEQTGLFVLVLELPVFAEGESSGSLLV